MSDSMSDSMTNHVIIDNCVVIKDGHGLRIVPFSLMKKLYPTVNLDNIKTIKSGNRYSDNKLLSHLSDGIMSFEDLINNYPI